MKKKISKGEAKREIDEFFQRQDFDSEEVKKIKRLAMQFNIKLGDYRGIFCKKCLSRLKGKLRVSKTHKTVVCYSCGKLNRIKFS